eukprot:CAMPEP_0194368308 /NCGR_PEP_ID=MMETSP0174-20130528/16569_1 /TAXON_ID=216777 /ORGANISM="Proboscia alata, Strain PI-D3" /LENGTH=335 /DNA_ID=CAMNT_0039144637 /DNA_START=65 /DNA_END=1072 /DNA_ORIENTATION=-
MKRCVSMLEFVDVRELQQVDDALRKLSLISNEGEYEEKKDSICDEIEINWKSAKENFDDEGWKRKGSGNHDRDSSDFSDSTSSINRLLGFEIQESKMKKSASFNCPSMEMASPEATMNKEPSFLGGTSLELLSSSEDGRNSAPKYTLPQQYVAQHPLLKPPPKKSGMKKVLSFSNLQIEDSPTSKINKRNKSNPELYEEIKYEFQGKMKRNVSFSDIKITEFDMTLGDNPCCRFGPPVQLAWESSGEENYNIDVYEEFRIPRSKEQLVMPSDLRMRLLATDAGYSLQELREAIKQGNKTKRQRQWTVSTLALSQLENMVEKTSRKIKRQIKKGDI